MRIPITRPDARMLQHLEEAGPTLPVDAPTESP